MNRLLAVDKPPTCAGESTMPPGSEVTPTDDRDHLLYADQNGDPDECVEDCPGCHWEGNLDCEALRSGCSTCDPDDVFAGDAVFLARRDEIAKYLAYEYEQPVESARWRAQELMAKVQKWIDASSHEWRCPSCGATTRARMADQ